jgi:hypothetical protein
MTGLNLPVFAAGVPNCFLTASLLFLSCCSYGDFLLRKCKKQTPIYISKDCLIYIRAFSVPERKTVNEPAGGNKWL